MSEKQLGAAPGEESEPVAGNRVGWFGRLRAQPGFRTASVAFVLTVVLGIGSTAAYAYWSQSQSLAISGTTVRQPLPALTGTTACGWNGLPLVSNVVISQPARPSVLPTGAAVIVDVDSPAGKRSYYLKNTGEFRLIDLTGLESSLRWGWDWRLTITVTTAYLKTTPTQHLALVPEADIESRALQAPLPATAHYYASFTCNRL